MTLLERETIFNTLFCLLQQTNSRNEKETALAHFRYEYPELEDDLNYIFETLAGRHPIGWTFTPRVDFAVSSPPMFRTIKECIQACEKLTPKTVENTMRLEALLNGVGLTLKEIVNRTLRLGIGSSQLEKSDVTPMLAKKYEGQRLDTTVFVTEKLDGNRCVARHDGEKWGFTSRSGKPMHVNFDMTGIDTDFIYDGEVMSTPQTALSRARYTAVIANLDLTEFSYDTKDSQLMFNTTSGLINRYGSKKGLVYNVFDIISDLPYHERRELLESIDTSYTTDVRILPVLYTGTDNIIVNSLLDAIVQMGGEGVMLNMNDRKYENRRSDALLKYKLVQYMDLIVLDIRPGTGKYEGQVGALECYIKTEDGKMIMCDVGTGLSDAQREQWSIDESEIIGHIIQVGYHELTQDRDCLGTEMYSMRFPRLIKVRGDKIDTSEF